MQTRKYEVKEKDHLFLLNEDGDILLEFKRETWDYSKNP